MFIRTAQFGSLTKMIDAYTMIFGNIPKVQIQLILRTNVEEMSLNS